MTTGTEIKRHANGSIDIPHYMKRGRRARSDEAWRMAAAIKSAIVGRIARILAAVKGGGKTPSTAKSPVGQAFPAQRAGRPRLEAPKRARHAAERTETEIVS